MNNSKLTIEQLKTILPKRPLHNPEIVSMGSQVGWDCALLSVSGRLAVTTDPITASSVNQGLLSVEVNVNDLASIGAKPVAMLLTMIAPNGTNISQLQSVAKQAYDCADGYGIDIVGGHTEYSDSVNRIVVSVTMFGQIGSFKPRPIQVGDSIVVTNYLATEATAILGTEKASQLDLTKQEIEQAKECFKHLSVYPEGLACSQLPCVKRMHDITEGGIVGAVEEVLCSCSGVGAELYRQSMPLTDLTKKICNQLNLDPLRQLSSGSMLIFTDDPTQTVEYLHQNGIVATVTGKLTCNTNVVVK